MEAGKCKRLYVFFRVVLTSIFLCLISACGREESESLATNELYFYIHAVADVETDVLTVTVNVRDGTELFADHIELTGAENIQAVFNGETKAMFYSTGFFDPLIGSFRYRARFDAGVSSGNNMVTVIFNRADGSAISTGIMIPDQFEITSPLNNAIYNFGNNESISTSWDVGLTPGNYGVSYIYSCRYANSNESVISLINQNIFTVAGNSELSVDEILTSISDDAYTQNNTECSVKVSVRNQLFGQAVNLSYGGGSTKSTMQNNRDVDVIPAQ